MFCHLFSKIIPRRILEGFLWGIPEINHGKFPEGTTKEKSARILGGISAKNHKDITELVHRGFIEVAFLGILKRTCGGIPKITFWGIPYRTSRGTTGILRETSGGIPKIFLKGISEDIYREFPEDNARGTLELLRKLQKKKLLEKRWKELYKEILEKVPRRISEECMLYIIAGFPALTKKCLSTTSLTEYI